MAFNIEYIIKAVDQFSGVARNISMSLAGISASAERAQKKFHHLERQFKVSARVMMESFTLPIIAISGFALKAFSDMEDLNSSIINAAGSSKYLASITSELQALADKGVGSMTELTTAATTLLHAGIKGSAVSGLMGQIGDISAGSHQKITDVAEFVAKIKEQGHLSAGDLTDLTKFGLEQPLLKMFHTMSGAPVQIAVLRKALAAGTISWGTFQDAIRQVTNATGIYYGQTKEQYNTLGGSIKALKNQFMDSIVPIGDEINKQLKIVPRIQQLQLAIKNFPDAFKNFVKLHPELTALIVKLGAVLAAIGPVLGVMALVSGVIMVAAGAVRFLLFPLRLLIGVVSAVSKAIAILDGVMTILEANPIVLLITAIAIAIGVLVYVIYKFRHQIAGFFSGVWSVVSDWTMDKINKIKKYINDVIALFNKLEAIASKVFSHGKSGNVNITGSVVSQGALAINAPSLHKSQVDVNVNLKGNTQAVQSVETKSKGNTKFNVGTNMLGAL